jgi:hypothetical protein
MSEPTPPTPPTPTTPPTPPTPPPGEPPPSAQWTAPAYPSTTASPRTSGLAVASLVTGILFCFFVTPVVAVITGHLALEQIADSDGRTKGRGLAIAGATLGWIWLGLAAIALAAWVVNVLVS